MQDLANEDYLAIPVFFYFDKWNLSSIGLQSKDYPLDLHGLFLLPSFFCINWESFVSWGILLELHWRKLRAISGPSSHFCCCNSWTVRAWLRYLNTPKRCVCREGSICMRRHTIWRAWEEPPFWIHLRRTYIFASVIAFWVISVFVCV